MTLCRRRVSSLLLCLGTAACAPGEKPAEGTSPAAAASNAAAPVAESAGAPRPRRDSVTPRPAAPRRDSAFGPTLEVDSSGKVRPIKKP